MDLTYGGTDVAKIGTKSAHSARVYICATANYLKWHDPPIGAGWSSPVARQAHNLKVAGSNPAPATK
jgi:hypothetical protein